MGLSLPHLIIFAVIIVLNFVPSIIAFVRKHEQKWLVFLLNLLLGWTGLGWIAAIVWAIVGKPAAAATDVGETFR